MDPKLEITEKDIDDALDSLVYSKYSQNGWDEKKCIVIKCKNIIIGLLMQINFIHKLK